MTTGHSLRSATLLLAVLLAACSQRGPSVPGSGAMGGTLVISVAADADEFLPPLTVNVTSVQVDGQLFEHLARPNGALNTIGDAGWTGELAQRWSWARDSLSIAFHLDPRAHWHDGQPVRARDVRFTYQLYRDPRTGSASGPLLALIDSVSTPDSLTAVFWFKQRSPEEFYDAAYQLAVLPEHLLDSVAPADLATSAFARHPIGSGPFRFVRWTPRQVVELAADTTYHLGRPRLDRLIWSIAPDPNATVMRVLAGEADVVEFLRAPDLAQVAARSDLRAVRYPSLGSYFLLFNEHDPNDRAREHPILSDRSVRRALAMAVDRRKLVRSVFDTLASVSLGPVTRAMSTWDSTLAQLPYNLDSARALLDAAGWRAASPGAIRHRNGVPLGFTIIVPSSSTPRMRMAVLLQSMLREAGAEVRLEPLDFPTWVQRMTTRHFDASMAGMQLDPAPSGIMQNWSSAAAQVKDGNNFGSYSNPAFDALLDSAVSRTDTAAAHRFYRDAYAMLISDAPAIWLYEPMNFAAVQRRVHPVGLRADAWWANLDRWYIPRAERIARDRIGAGAAPSMVAARP